MKKILATLFVLMAATYQLACNKSATPAASGNPSISLTPTVSNFTSVSSPYGVTGDDAGNIYYSQNRNPGYVVEVNPSGSATTISGGMSYPRALAVASDGTVYTTARFYGRIIKIKNGVSSDFSFQHGRLSALALANGNIYFAAPKNRYNTSGVWAVPASGGSPVRVGSGWNRPHGVAVDHAGNIYGADTFNGKIVKITGNTQSDFATGLNKPWGVVTDAAGNVYVTERGNGRVDKFDTSGTTKTILATVTTPRGIWVTSDGSHVYVADSGAGVIRRIDPPVWPH